MTRGRTIYSATHLVSSIVMLLALAWLTVCLPYVYEGQQKQKQHVEQKSKTRQTADNNNPLTNTTEEKTPNGAALSEYLHEAQAIEHHFIILTSCFHHQHHDVYLAFHPEKVSPPPKA